MVTKIDPFVYQEWYADLFLYVYQVNFGGYWWEIWYEHHTNGLTLVQESRFGYECAKTAIFWGQNALREWIDTDRLFGDDTIAIEAREFRFIISQK